MIAIGEAAKRSGVSIETIRYYEREGIIGKARRTPSGRRAYTEQEVSELRFIKRCRDLGFALHDACALRALSEEPANTCREVEHVWKRHLKNVRKKIAELQRLEKALHQLVANCSEGSVSCPILVELFAEPSVIDL